MALSQARINECPPYTGLTRPDKSAVRLTQPIAMTGGTVWAGQEKSLFPSLFDIHHVFNVTRKPTHACTNSAVPNPRADPNPQSFGNQRFLAPSVSKSHKNFAYSLSLARFHLRVIDSRLIRRLQHEPFVE